MKTIEVANVGPVTSVSIPVPDEGGVVVLRGRNGSGKSRTLDAVQSLVAGKGKVDVKDGALHGMVEAFGVTMKVGRSTRRSGELEIQSLEGRLSVAEFVDPGIKDPQAADAKRVKALVALTGVEPKPEMFYELIGGKANLERFTQPESLQQDDLVAMADKIKRDLESAARSAEKDMTRLAGSLAILNAQVFDLPKGESDPVKLQDEMTKAIQRESDLVAQKRSSVLANQKVIAIRQSLAEMSVCDDDLERCIKERDELRVHVRQLEDSVIAAKSELTAATKLAEDVRLRVSKVAALNNELDSVTLLNCPTDDEIKSAVDAVTAARESLERGAIIRKSKEIEAKIKQTKAEFSRTEERAMVLREASKATDLVLDEQVSKLCPLLKVDDGRLVLETKRGQTYFSDLSDGERWKLGLDIAIDAVGEHGLITLPQAAWESLDDFARHDIADHVKSRGAVVLTAECGTEEEICGVLYE